MPEKAGLEKQKGPDIAVTKVEKKIESQPESAPVVAEKGADEREIANLKKVVGAKASDGTTTQQVVKSETRLQVEKILEEDLVDVYKTMDAKQQQAFKEKGKEVATNIEILVETLKTRAKIVLGYIRDWLSIIPGVNKFFLEQESKIKTDRIMDLARKRRKQIKLKNKNKI